MPALSKTVEWRDDVLAYHVCVRFETFTVSSLLATPEDALAWASEIYGMDFKDKNEFLTWQAVVRRLTGARHG